MGLFFVFVVGAAVVLLVVLLTSSLFVVRNCLSRVGAGVVIAVVVGPMTLAMAKWTIFFLLGSFFGQIPMNSGYLFERASRNRGVALSVDRRYPPASSWRADSRAFRRSSQKGPQ